MKLKDLASKLGLELRGDGEIEITTPAPIEAAASGTIVFAAVAKYGPALRSAPPASCAIVTPELAPEARCAVLLSTNPYADFARVLEMFFPPERPAEGIDPTARIAPDAKLGARASVGAYSVIGPGTMIGDRAVIHPHATIYPGVRAGDDLVCHSHVSIREGTTIGNRVTILNGAVIGAEGFGYVEHQGGLVRIPQVGGVVLEDDVEVGANSTIDRATMGQTILRRGVKLDDHVHIGHNCDAGEFSRFAAHTGLAGSVRVGKWCQFGGQSGCADHVKIGDRSMVAAQAGIHRELKPGSIVGGTPAIDIRAWRRWAAARSHIHEVFRRVRKLEERISLRPANDRSAAR